MLSAIRFQNFLMDELKLLYLPYQLILKLKLEKLLQQYFFQQNYKHLLLVFLLNFLHYNNVLFELKIVFIPISFPKSTSTTKEGFLAFSFFFTDNYSSNSNINFIKNIICYLFFHNCSIYNNY